jgi:hypothetical protein
VGFVVGVACKPSSVPRTSRGGDHFSRPAVADGLKQPTRNVAFRPGPDRPARLPVALLLGLARGGVYLARAVTRPAVRSYRTISTLPVTGKPAHRRYPFCCTGPHPGKPGRVGVTHHRVLSCSDFPRQAQGPPRPPAHANGRIVPAHSHTHTASRGIFCVCPCTTCHRKSRSGPAPAMRRYLVN